MEINLFELESRLRCRTPLHRMACKQILFKFCLRGLSLFLEGKLDRLDPHVGDTACQIRACQLIFLSQEMVQKNTRTYYEAFCQKLKQEIQILESGQLSELGILPEEIFFFGVSFFLTVFRASDEFGGAKAIKYLQIAKFLKISKTWAKWIIQVAQKALSMNSCDFIFRLSHKIDYPYSHLLKKLLQEGDDDRQLLPCFFLSDVIWRYLKKEKIPILFEVHSVEGHSSGHLLPGGGGQGGGADEHRLVESKLFLNKENLGQKACFHVVCRATAIRGIDASLKILENLFYANQSIHSQYAGNRLKSFKEDPFDLLKSQERAFYKKAEGFYLESRSLQFSFVIVHMKVLSLKKRSLLLSAKKTILAGEFA